MEIRWQPLLQQFEGLTATMLQSNSPASCLPLLDEEVS
jgi:hypothetical protein